MDTNTPLGFNFMKQNFFTCIGALKMGVFKEFMVKLKGGIVYELFSIEHVKLR